MEARAPPTAPVPRDCSSDESIDAGAIAARSPLARPVSKEAASVVGSSERSARGPACEVRPADGGGGVGGCVVRSGML